MPVPLAFSAEQAAFLLCSCQVILTDEAGSRRLEQWRRHDLRFPENTLAVEIVSEGDPSIEFIPSVRDHIIKVIHTSGTTSTPKGVQIRSGGLNELVLSLQECVREDDYQRYLNLVPLSLLIEQVTAIYMPLTIGGCVVMPPVEMAPLGDPSVTAEQRLNLIRQASPSAMTLTPALVDALAEKARDYAQHDERIDVLFGRKTVPLLAAGGAPISEEILHELNGYGIPVYQGYGLSENSSVATWNCRGANRIGTVGKPLRHVEVKLLDPMQHHFLTRLLHNHGLDEARHIQCDHMVFDTIIPSFSASERRRMHEIIGQTEALNTALALASQETIQAAFDLDYTENNFAAKTQLDTTLKFREIIQSGDYIKKVDEHLDDDTTQILQIFANASQIHAA
ncbi:AMP-binding protein [Vibrio sp. PP-XX7]